MMRKKHQFAAVSKSRLSIYTPFFKLAYVKTNNLVPHFGIIVTKKIGNAVVRNKIKRRIRAIIRDIIKDSIGRNNVIQCYNFVIIARKTLYDGDYKEIKTCFLQALLKIH